MIKFLLSLFKKTQKPERIPFLGLHMALVTKEKWLVRMHRNKRLELFEWSPR